MQKGKCVGRGSEERAGRAGGWYQQLLPLGFFHAVALKSHQYHGNKAAHTRARRATSRRKYAYMERGVNRTEIKTKQNGNGAVTPYDLPPIGQNTKREERERERDFFPRLFTHMPLSPLLYCQPSPHSSSSLSLTPPSPPPCCPRQPLFYPYN